MDLSTPIAFSALWGEGIGGRVRRVQRVREGVGFMLGVVGGCYWDDGKDASAADGESGVVDVWEAGEDLLRGFDVGEVIEVEDYEGGV